MRWFIRNCFLLTICRIIECSQGQSKWHLFKARPARWSPLEKAKFPRVFCYFRRLEIFSIFLEHLQENTCRVLYTKHYILPANNSGQIEFWIMTVSIKYSCAHWRICWSHAAHYCQSKEPYWWTLRYVRKSPPLTPYIEKACLDSRYDMRD